jgi:hypothetical protein
MRIRWWATAVSATLACGASGIQAQSPAPTADDSDAIAALQGVHTAPVIDAADIAVTAAAIRAIRERVPEVRGIRGLPIWNVLDVALSPHGERRIAEGLGRTDDIVTVARTGLPALDSVNTLYGASRVEVHRDVWDISVNVWFGRPVNMLVLAERYLDVPDVAYAIPGFFSGSQSRITLARKGTVLDFVFDRRGPGCGALEASHRYFVSYDTRDARVLWHGEQCIANFDEEG